MRGTWDCNGKWGFFLSNKLLVEGLVPEKPLLCSLVLNFFCYSRRRRNFPQSFSLSGSFGFGGWCSEYFGERNSWLFVQNLTLHCSVQILLQEGCKVLTPGEKLTQSCSWGSLRIWALKDKKSKPEISTFKLRKKLVTEEQMSTWSVSCISQCQAMSLVFVMNSKYCSPE